MSEGFSFKKSTDESLVENVVAEIWKGAATSFTSSEAQSVTILFHNDTDETWRQDGESYIHTGAERLHPSGHIIPPRTGSMSELDAKLRATYVFSKKSWDGYGTEGVVPLKNTRGDRLCVGWYIPLGIKDNGCALAFDGRPAKEVWEELISNPSQPPMAADAFTPNGGPYVARAIVSARTGGSVVLAVKIERNK